MITVIECQHYLGRRPERQFRTGLFSFVFFSSAFRRPSVIKMGAGHFGHKTFRHRDTSAPQNWCRSLRRVTVELCLIGIVLGRSVPAFPRSLHPCRSVSYHVFWCRSVLRSVPKCPECLDAEVSCDRSVR